ncbi:uncharacterized protein [Anabrus simplex]|uniref:uncharacterized protein n=1 Tax=Anabrus simplex TaxID=316456 RepID=UPI0035A3C84B
MYPSVVPILIGESPGYFQAHDLILYQSLFSPPQNEKTNKNNVNWSSRNDNLLCDSPDGTTGLCYTSQECEDLGGMSLASCADGEGVCCLVEKSCRNITQQMVSYFVNPSYPNQDTVGSFCDYRIDITNTNVCQIRLDLEQFSLVGPHRTMGICRNDRFMAMTSLPNGIGLSDLCGENSGQHIYVPVDAAVGSASVSLMVMTSGTKPYHWRIRTTQIDCKEQPELVAPTGCLQYHTEMAGTIQSFNYQDGQGHYQSNLDYAICIQRSPNTCRVEYRQTENSLFWINSAEGPELQEGVGRTGIVSCDLTSHDYLHIPGGRGGSINEEGDGATEQTVLSTASTDKFCGRSLSGLAVEEYAERLRSGYVLDPPENITTASVVTSFASGPMVLRFHSDEVSEPDQEIGFSITYQQLGTGCIRP